MICLYNKVWAAPPLQQNQRKVSDGIFSVTIFKPRPPAQRNHVDPVRLHRPSHTVGATTRRMRIGTYFAFRACLRSENAATIQPIVGGDLVRQAGMFLSRTDHALQVEAVLQTVAGRKKERRGKAFAISDIFGGPDGGRTSPARPISSAGVSLASLHRLRMKRYVLRIDDRRLVNTRKNFFKFRQSTFSR